MYAARPPRALSAAAALTIVRSVAAWLVHGLGVARSTRPPPALVAIRLAPPRPSPTQQPKRLVRPSSKPAAKGDPSPPNLRNKAAQVVAEPVLLLIPPPPVMTATEAGIGSAANTGAADVAGPGRGAGGIGNGDGGGGSGGDDRGEGGGAVVGPRRTKGRLAYDDLPPGLLHLGQEATVEVLYTVGANGRVSACRAVRSSGFALLDTLACQLIEKRFRFRPARDRSGRAVPAAVSEAHTWVEDGENGAAAPPGAG